MSGSHQYVWLVWALAALLVSGPATAGHASGHLTAPGIEVYYGIVPAALVRGHERDHSGKPADPSAWHLVVALYDSATGQRITEADVTARVRQLGGFEQYKTLEPMPVAGAATFGQYFAMPGHDPYLVTLQILRPGADAPVEVRFEHRHP